MAGLYDSYSSYSSGLSKSNICSWQWLWTQRKNVFILSCCVSSLRAWSATVNHATQLLFSWCPSQLPTSCCYSFALRYINKICILRMPATTFIFSYLCIYFRRCDTFWSFPGRDDPAGGSPVLCHPVGWFGYHLQDGQICRSSFSCRLGSQPYGRVIGKVSLL